MVFDIDMDVYDDVRSCCKGANVCERCWVFPIAAMKVLTVILDEDFDFQNILWVFSGRRGIHGWVCDEEARSMTNEMRSAVVAYCNIGTGNELSGKLNLNYPLHPRLMGSYKILLPMFEDIIIRDHNLLSQEVHREKFLAYLPHEDVRKNVRQKWPKGGDAESCESQGLWDIYLAEHKKWK